jgi:hypothetical protein
MDDERLSNVLNYLSSLHWIKDQPHKAIELRQNALTLSRKTNHHPCRWEPHRRSFLKGTHPSGC